MAKEIYKISYKLNKKKETKGTFVLEAVNDEGEFLSEAKERLPVGSNVIYIMKSEYGKAPKRATVKVTLIGGEKESSDDEVDDDEA